MDTMDIDIVERRAGYQGYFRLDIYRLRHRLHDGGWSGVMQREVLERGHAAAALLYTAQTQVLSISIWAFFENANWGAASALSVIATIVTVGMMALVMRAPLRL